MKDEWFAEKFCEISDRLGKIEQNNEDQSKSIERAFKKIESHSKRIRKLENRSLVEKEKKNWIQANPGKSLTIGGVSLTTIGVTVLGVLRYFGII